MESQHNPQLGITFRIDPAEGENLNLDYEDYGLRMKGNANMMRMAGPAHPGQFIRMELIEALGPSVAGAAEVLGETQPTLVALLSKSSRKAPSCWLAEQLHDRLETRLLRDFMDHQGLLIVPHPSRRGLLDGYFQAGGDALGRCRLQHMDAHDIVHRIMQDDADKVEIHDRVN